MEPEAKIVTRIREDNEASIVMHERMGFVDVGIEGEYVFFEFAGGVV